MTAPPGDVLVVVPAKNEADTIAGVVTGLAALGYPTLVVDDGSTDATAMLAAGAGAIVVSMPFNLGVGGALRCGFQYAVDHGYRLVVQCDGDGQHRADQVAVLLDCQQQTGPRKRSPITRCAPVRCWQSRSTASWSARCWPSPSHWTTSR